MPTARQNDIDPAVAAVVRAKARALARGGAIPRGDVADAEQNLTLAALAARRRFEPADPGAPVADRVALAADVAAAVAALPPDLRAAAEALKTDTVAAAARALGVSRAAMYARVREIRSWFERAGLGAGR